MTTPADPERVARLTALAEQRGLTLTPVLPDKPDRDWWHLVDGNRCVGIDDGDGDEMIELPLAAVETYLARD